MSISIRVEARALRDVRRKLKQVPDKVPQAISSALNRTATNITKNASKETRKRYHVKAGDIKSNLTKTKANRSSLYAEVKVKGKVLGIDKFKVNPKTVNRKRKKQLKISIKKGNIKQITGAFIANLGGIKVAKRTSPKRLPLERLFGPSVPQMIGNEEVAKVINEEAGKTYEKRLDHEINRLLDKLGG